MPPGPPLNAGSQHHLCEVLGGGTHIVQGGPGCSEPADLGPPCPVDGDAHSPGPAPGAFSPEEWVSAHSPAGRQSAASRSPCTPCWGVFQSRSRDMPLLRPLWVPHCLRLASLSAPSSVSAPAQMAQLPQRALWLLLPRLPKVLRLHPMHRALPRFRPSAGRWGPVAVLAGQGLSACHCVLFRTLTLDPGWAIAGMSHCEEGGQDDNSHVPTWLSQWHGCMKGIQHAVGP